MKSVKGLTWGRPEFIEKAKTTELEGEARDEVTRKLDEIEALAMTLPEAIFEEARARAAIIFELHDDNEMW